MTPDTNQHIERLNEFRGFNPKYDEALDGLLEQLEAVTRERDEALRFAREAADNWIRPALQQLGEAADRLRAHGVELPSVEEVTGILAASTPATGSDS